MKVLGGVLAAGLLPFSTAASEWKFGAVTDPITQTKTYIATLASVDLAQNAETGKKAPELAIRCQRKKLDVILFWPSVVACGRVKLEYRTPTGSVRSESWRSGTTCSAFFSNDPRGFLARISTDGEIIMRLIPEVGAVKDASFSSNKITSLLDGFKVFCPVNNRNN